jgi:hypothetical protein
VKLTGFDLCRAAMGVDGVTAPEQSVLLTLAVMANEDAQCWPGIAKLVELTKLSERTVQRSVQGLKEAGHLNWIDNPGRGRVYIVHPRHGDTPQDATPATETPATVTPRQSGTPVTVAPTPATVAPKQPRTTNTSQKASPSSRAREPDRYHRLPADWSPTKPLPEALAAKVAQWPPGKLESEIEGMREWAANAKNENGKGKKLCWDTALHGWLRRADDDWRAKPANRNGANCNGLGPTASAAISVFGEPGRQADRSPPPELRRIGFGGR